MSKLYEALIRDTVVLKISVEAPSRAKAWAEIERMIDNDRNWRSEAETFGGGIVWIDDVQEVKQATEKLYRVRFSECVSYEMTFSARDAVHAERLATLHLMEGSTDSFEETSNTRSRLDVQEVGS